MLRDEIYADILANIGKRLIKNGEDDIRGYEVGMDILENTRNFINILIEDYRVNLTDKQLYEAYYWEIDDTGIVSPGTYEQYLLYAKDEDGHKLIDRRNKQLVSEIRKVLRIAYRLYQVGVDQ